MNIINLIYRKRLFDKQADRLGPDLPFTHFRLFFKESMKKICKKKFKQFSDTAEFRPGAYAVGCSRISIGNRVVIRPGTMLFADAKEKDVGITIENDVLIGSCVHFYVGNHNFSNPTLPIIDQGHSESRSILIRKGSWIGANVTILSGVEIGENVVVGAGSIVTKSFPSGVIIGGNPARVLKIIDTND